ncbi:hypothetical protein AB0F59_09300 [Micromonospora lupini]|uniref:Imm32 family immunity protein n=1 Tax=Micromonospora lupini TaxID=285679 RepID=UPI0033F9B91F
MKILFYLTFGYIDLSGTADDYRALAALISAGGGTYAAEHDAPDPFGGTALSCVRISTTANSMVLISVDHAGGTLQISGAPAPLAIFASNLESMAADEHGGHLHIEHYPDHPYLGPASADVIVNSPHGGMPTR